MNFASRVLLVLALVLMASNSAFAQTPQSPNYPGLGAGVGMGLSIVGIGIGLGLIGFSALSGIARQPEQAGRLQGVMILMAALVEGAGIISLILCFVVALITR